MSGHIYRINFLQLNTKGSKKGKKDKKGKFQAFFDLFVFFAFFASTLPFTVNPDFENYVLTSGCAYRKTRGLPFASFASLRLGEKWAFSSRRQFSLRRKDAKGRPPQVKRFG